MSTFVYLNCCRVYIRTIISYMIVNCHYFKRIQWIIQIMTAVLWTGKYRILVFLGQYTVYYILLNTVIFSNQIDELKYHCAPKNILLWNNVPDAAFQNSASGKKQVRIREIKRITWISFTIHLHIVCEPYI